MRKPKAKKTATRAKKKPAKIDHAAIEATRAKAYSAMEPYVCDLVNMGTIAMDQFDKDDGLFVFAVGKLEDMLKEFRKRYYAEEFPPA
jgi:hypothetical protein